MSGFPSGIEKLTSSGGTVTITDPTGPVTDLSATAALASYLPLAGGTMTGPITGDSGLLPLADFNSAGKNAIINGGMDIWQRGTTFASTTAVTYSADRWCYSTSATASTYTISKVASGLAGFVSALRVQRASGSTVTTNIATAQSVETFNAIPFAGQTVTLSFYARAGSNYSMTSSTISLSVNGGTGTDQNIVTGYTGSTPIISVLPVLTTSWQRFTYTFTVGSTITELGLYFNFFPTGTAGTDDYFDITGVQLELGSVATPFSRAGGSIGGELALCQRYYWRNTGIEAYQSYCSGQFSNSTTALFPIPLPVTMRIVPSFTSSVAANFITPNGSSNLPVSAIALDVSSPNVVNLSVTISGATQGQAALLRDAGSANSYLGFSAEL